MSIPATNIQMLNTEVTQKLYQYVMGENPSKFKGENNPVGGVSWYDAIYFCNELSKKFYLTPVYALDGETDVTKWGYTPHKGDSIHGDITWDSSANGYRLPTNDEWRSAAKGGQKYDYAGSDNLDEVGWYYDNSGGTTHPVAQKKPNGYGLYDMSGNVSEWVWDSYYDWRCYCGGSWNISASASKVSSRSDSSRAYSGYYYIGFRVVRVTQ